MLYLVFSRYNTAHEIYYVGGDKSVAVDTFQWATDFVFDATLKTGNLYFVCFDTSIEPGSVFKDKTSAADYTAADINTVIKNINRAAGSSCLYTHVPFCANTKLNPTAILCDGCKNNDDKVVKPAAVYQTAYGKCYCTDCWNDYIHPAGGTDPNATITRTDGLVEYIIGIACGTYSPEAFTETERKFIAAVWAANKTSLTHLPAGETRETIETKCRAKGFDFSI